MITILAIILAIFISYRQWKCSYLELSDKIMFTFMTFAITTVLLFAFLLTLGQSWIVETHRDECDTSIYSMKSVSGIEGQFCLGSGYIDNAEYYYMFQKYDDGGLHRIQLLSRNCVIYQNENNHPHLHWQIIHYRLPYWALWPNIKKAQSTDNTMYYIYVPTNSVVLRFNVD